MKLVGGVVVEVDVPQTLGGDFDSLAFHFADDDVNRDLVPRHLQLCRQIYGDNLQKPFRILLLISLTSSSD